MREIKAALRLALAASGALLVALASAAGASAATAPTAITGAVTQISSSTATITGTVNPNGVTTNWYFEFGPTTSYGTRTAATNDGSGTGNSDVSASLTGLTPGTTYHYRLVATSSGGTAVGTDGIFTTTTATTPVAVTTAATAVTGNSATLNGTVNPNGSPTTWYFEYGTSTSYGSRTPSQTAGSGTGAVRVSVDVTGLTAGQTYHFHLVATSAAGTAQGGDMTFGSTAGPSATTKPAKSVTSTSARLLGVVNPNGQATTWYFEYGTTTSYGSTTPVENAGSGRKKTNVAITVTGLSPGVYHFRLVAVNPSGTAKGNDRTFGGGPPVVLTGSAQGAAATSVTLTGSVNPEGHATRWYFEYGTTTSYGSKTAAKSAGSGSATTGVSAAISNLASGTTYHYRLVGRNSGGTTFGGDVTFTTVMAVTMTASTLQSVYGRPATLSGTVSSAQAGVTVSILAQPFGTSSYSTVGTTLTGPGGTWTFKVRPKILTAYRAGIADGASTPMSIGVRPAVSLRVITKARFLTRVVASKSFKGKIVQLQRALPGGRWKTLARAHLNAKSSAVFSAKKLPRGTTTIRIAMSVNQAGAGFLGAFSRTLSYVRR